MRFRTSFLQSIGRIRGNVIRIHKRWREALDGIEGFSHIIVLFWIHRAHKPEMKIHPKRLENLPKVGFLATRTPHRPNPIGMTVVRLIKRNGARLRVEGLDLWDGTPILDVKPYTPRDSILRFKIPRWVHQLDQQESDPLRKYRSLPAGRQGDCDEIVANTEPQTL